VDSDGFLGEFPLAAYSRFHGGFVKIERETGKDYRRWSVETHPWVEKSLAAVFYTVVAGGTGAAIAGSLARLLGH
jgi:hypothetical protein